MNEADTTREETKVVSLTNNEVMVLSSLLYRWMDEDGSARNVRLEYQAEQRALWDLAMQLEQQNDFIFAHDYDKWLERARRAVQDSESVPENEVGLKRV